MGDIVFFFSTSGNSIICILSQLWSKVTTKQKEIEIKKKNKTNWDLEHTKFSPVRAKQHKESSFIFFVSEL